MANTFPTTIKDVSREWIAGIFGIDPESISAFNIEIPQDNPGYGSDIGFLRLTTSEPGVPSSMMLKVPPRYPDAAELIRKAGSFRREATFYKYLAPQTPVRTPTIYAVEIEDESGDAIMVMEDCSNMKQFSFLDDPPATVEHLRLIVGAIASLHAHWWNRADELTEYDSIMHPGHEVWQNLAQDSESGFDQWLNSSFIDFAPQSSLAVCKRLAGEFKWFITDCWPTSNLTLCHMDYHVQNLFLDTENTEDPIVIFDWDGCHIGSGVHDIAYLLSFLPVDFRRRQERGLLTVYHEALTQSGVSQYTFEQLMSDYRFGCLFNAFLLPMALDLDLSGDIGVAFARLITQGILTNILDHDAHLLLDELKR